MLIRSNKFKFFYGTALWVRVIIVAGSLLALSSCLSGSGDDSPGSAGGSQQSGGGANDSSGTPGGGGGTGDAGGGTGDGSGSDPGGGTGGGSGTGGGGDSGGGTIPVYGSFSSLYTASNEPLTVVSCTNPSSGSKTFSLAVFRLIGQNGNFVDAVISLTSTNSSEFDQIFINLSGEFHPDGSFHGIISNMIYSLNGAIITQAVGGLLINIYGTSMSVEFTADSVTPDCGLTDGFFMTEETVDPGTGGGGGTGGSGGSGGGTGTDTGTGTTGTDGSLIQATGQFGMLTFTSTDYPLDNGTYELTTAVMLTHPGHEVFTWANTEQTTINVYFGFGEGQAAAGHMTFNSVNGRSYTCLCFPTIDLVNYEANFSNLILTDGNFPPGSITVNGILAFPVIN